MYIPQKYIPQKHIPQAKVPQKYLAVAAASSQTVGRGGGGAVNVCEAVVRCGLPFFLHCLFCIVLFHFFLFLIQQIFVSFFLFCFVKFLFVKTVNLQSKKFYILWSFLLKFELVLLLSEKQKNFKNSLCNASNYSKIRKIQERHICESVFS